MEAWDAICARRNVRQYRPEPVSEEDLNRIAEAGWRAPSAKNRQPWDFVVVTDRTQLKELSTVWRGAGHIAAAAAAIAIVVPVPPDDRRKITDSYDVGQATMAMMIAATTYMKIFELLMDATPADMALSALTSTAWLVNVVSPAGTPDCGTPRVSTPVTIGRPPKANAWASPRLM